MANMLFANNCNTTLNGGITAIATSMVVTSATGFPAPTGSQYFYCTLADAATQTTIEIVKVTAVSGTTFTIVRGQDGTTGTIFASGAVVSLRLVAASLNDFPKLDEANTFTGTITFSTPLLATNMVQSTTSTSGYLSNTDWNTFNGKAPAVTYTTGYVPYGQGTTTPNQSANLQFDGNNLGVGYSPSSFGGYTVLSVGNISTTKGLITIRDGAVGDCGFLYFNGTDFKLEGVANYPVNIASVSGQPIKFSASVSEKMRIHASGGVSIGNTTDPGATNLSVTGEVYATKGVGGTPAFSVYSSNAQSISSGATAKIQLNNKVFDTATAFDATTNYRFTPQVAGYYQLNGQVALNGGATGYARLQIFKNGGSVAEGNSIPNNTITGAETTVSTIVYLNGSTDYVELYCYLYTGAAALTLQNSTTTNYFTGALIRGA